jgi:hypothetical protein
MTLAVTLALFQALIALLKGQTDLMVAAVAANPAKTGELIGRFVDDTRWIHVALAWQNTHLCKLLGEVTVTAEIPVPAVPAK